MNTSTSDAPGRLGCSSDCFCSFFWSCARCVRRWPSRASKGSSSGAIGLFYGAGLAWGQHTHLSIVEYWRWWVVHLWVEGFFEVFATTVIAFFFTRLGLLKPKLAAEAALMSAIIFLSGGIIGTCHHLYFFRTPTVALGFGAVLSGLEVVPLVLAAYGAGEDYQLSRLSPWAARYRWPIYFFVVVAFWNMLGAGGRSPRTAPTGRT